MPAFDVVIRGATVIDGSGREGYLGDVAVNGGRIAQVGRVDGRGAREVDALGAVVAPGFIDAHTHMDAQLFWDPIGSSSCWHGVTTVVTGNCGFSLAPARSDGRDLVIRNLERAEDIAPEAMAAGIEWTWQSFPEFLDAVDAAPKAINYACQVGHSALRTWAMGERAFDGAATEDDLHVMEGELTAALAAGAVGFTTSRAGHQTSTGQPVASRLASWDEVTQLVRLVGSGGMFELANDADCRSDDPEVRERAFEQLSALALDTGVVLTFGVPSITSEISGRLLDFIDSTVARGARVVGQSSCREMWLLTSFLTALPFDVIPEWRALRNLAVPEKRRLLADRAARRALVDAANAHRYAPSVGPEPPPPNYDEMCVFDSPFPPYRTVTDVARARGVDPVDAMIDLALETDFRQLFAQAGANRNRDDIVRGLRHRNSVMTFTDSGAHVSQIIDSSLQTYLLSYWARMAKVLTLEEAVRMLTSAIADVWGFADRGRIAPGMVADLNIFDPERIGPALPTIAHDLPGGATRLVQRAEGMRSTIVDGEIVFDSGEHTGALPGRLLRGTRCPR